ncbi:CapA family protein [Verrucomicrobiota bacterium]
MVNKLTLAAVGDIMLTRQVGEKIKEHGPFYPFCYIADALKKFDIVFANLETPVTSRGQPSSKQCPHITFRSDPSSVSGLKQAGVNIVSLANNHMVDYGDIGVLDTIDILSRHDIYCVGAGINEQEARRPAIIEKKGYKIAFLAYSSAFQAGTYIASRHKAGGAQLILKDIQKDIRDIIQKVDFVIVSLHWGIEYDDYPVPVEMDIARRIIDAGAALVLGHGPHYIQGIEEYNNGKIVYSLGNFVFDEPFQKSNESYIFGCTLGNSRIISSEILPVIINGEYQPLFAPIKVKQEIQNRIESLTESYRKFPQDKRELNNYQYLADIYRKLSQGCPFSIIKNFHLSLITPKILLKSMIRLRGRHISLFLKVIVRLMYRKMRNLRKRIINK